MIIPNFFGLFYYAECILVNGIDIFIVDNVFNVVVNGLLIAIFCGASRGPIKKLAKRLLIFRPVL